jgi:hypothetical protein
LPARAAGKPIEVWFQDEARVGQQGTLTHVWAERGSRPPGVRDDRHDSAWAVRRGLPDPKCGRRARDALGQRRGDELAPGRDRQGGQPRRPCLSSATAQAGIQLGGTLEVPDNVSLLHLPGYAPQLNPIENVWEYLRGNHLSITVWDTYDQIVDACCRAWNAFINDRDRVFSITNRAWAQVTS